jgi:hypothetical protein
VNNIATHNAPAWGLKSNFIIRADLARHGLPGRIEQLWARRIAATQFEICCIPFFTYGLALGDTVETNAQNTIQKTTEKGGHQTLRVAIALQERQDRLHEIVHEWVIKTGLLHEWYSTGYLAVDLPPDTRDEVNFQMLEPLNANAEIAMEIDE